jgi:hypothetical protein
MDAPILQSPRSPGGRTDEDQPGPGDVRGRTSSRSHEPTELAYDDDRPAEELDDIRDREELRDRYYGLLQELRVLLPGVQILVAFLFTVPFSSRFDQLDAVGRDLYGVALVSGLLAVVAFTTPTVFHRVGARRSRSLRLQWGIRTTRAGLVLLAISLVSALIVVARVVLDVPLAIAAVATVVVALIGLWVVLPLVTAGRGQDADRDAPDDPSPTRR